MIIPGCKGGCEIQLTFEQNEFKLCGSSYTWTFFIKYVLYILYYPRLVESVLWNCGYRWSTGRIYIDFGLVSDQRHQPPCCSRVSCVVFGQMVMGPAKTQLFYIKERRGKWKSVPATNSFIKKYRFLVLFEELVLASCLETAIGFQVKKGNFDTCCLYNCKHF